MPAPGTRERDNLPKEAVDKIRQLDAKVRLGDGRLHLRVLPYLCSACGTSVVRLPALVSGHPAAPWPNWCLCALLP